METLTPTMARVDRTKRVSESRAKSYTISGIKIMFFIRIIPERVLIALLFRQNAWKLWEYFVSLTPV